MGIITLHTVINSDRKKVFDLSRSIDLHLQSASQTQERAIAGKRQGLMDLGDVTRWRAKHFGSWFELEVEITQMDTPNSFTDEMLEGNFAFMKHQHTFEELAPGKTLMIDRFAFKSPYGLVGRVVDLVFLNGYMQRFLVRRNAMIKVVAEGGL